MLYSLWSLLSIGLFIFFIATCYKATKLIREKFGLFASIVFGFGLLSFGCNSGDKDEITEKKKQVENQWTFKVTKEIEPNTEKSSRIVIEKYLFSKIDLLVLYAREKSSGNIVPIEAYSNITGLTGGHKWKPERIFFKDASNSKIINFTVTGTLKWQLLGTTIYSQRKD